MSLDELAGKLMKDIPTQTLPQWHKIAKRVIQDYPGSDAAHEAQLMLDS